jgi:sortase A
LAATAVGGFFFQAREAQTFQQQFESKRPPAAGTTVHASPVEGSQIARLTIPDLGMTSIVVEGVSRQDLIKGPGHIPGTSSPGEAGNVGIAGHRDTVFRPLRFIRKDQIITIGTRTKETRYRVVATTVVDPKNIEVLKPTGRDTLTLFTCYPFDFVGPAPKRFIVRAERVP